MDNSRDLQQQTTGLLLQRPSAGATRDLAGGRPFSPFRPTDLARATARTDRLLTLADQSDRQAVLDEVARMNGADDPALVKHAFLVFLTHHELLRQQRPLPRPPQHGLSLRPPVRRRPHPGPNRCRRRLVRHPRHTGPLGGLIFATT